MPERPESDEYAPYYARYVDLVRGDGLEALAAQIEDTLAELGAVSERDSLKRYAPGKWSLREVVGHLVDTERIFTYRALRFARDDPRELPGFEENEYVAAARFDERGWKDLLEELALVRRSTVALFRGLRPEAWLRRGIANGQPISVRALAYNVAGHELHHMKIVRERYFAG